MLGALKMLGVECTVDPTGKMCEVRGNAGVFRQGVYLRPRVGHRCSHRDSPLAKHYAELLTVVRTVASTRWSYSSAMQGQRCGRSALLCA